MLNILLKVCQKNMEKILEKVLNIMYFIVLNFEKNEVILKQFFKISVNIFSCNNGILFQEFFHFLLFNSPINFFEISEKNIPFALKFLNIYLKNNIIENKPEYVAILDRYFSKIMANWPNQKYVLDILGCLEALVLNNRLKFEQNLLLKEIDLFLERLFAGQNGLEVVQKVKSL